MLMRGARPLARSPDRVAQRSASEEKRGRGRGGQEGDRESVVFNLRYRDYQRDYFK